MSARSASARKKSNDVHSTKSKSNQSSRPRAHAHPHPVPVIPEYHYDQYQYHGSNAGGYHYNMSFPSPPGPPAVPRGPMSISGHSNDSGGSGSVEIDSHDAVERSGFRNLMDKRSDGVRRGLAKTFAFKKKEKEDTPSMTDRPESQATVRQGALTIDTGGSYGFEDHHHQPSPRMTMQRSPMPQQLSPFPPQHQYQHYPVSPPEPHDMAWPGPPPNTKLPPTPQQSGPTIRRFNGGGRSSHRWNKLRKDPELWDPSGDVLVYLGHRDHGEPPNLRLSSHIIEATKNRHLITMLQEGFVEDQDQLRSPRRVSYWGQPTPPVSETDEFPDGDISYELCFPPPPGTSRSDAIRHKITTRNMFALIYRVSLVGLSLYQALCDLHVRLEKYRSAGEVDTTAQLLNYISTRSLDDSRSDVESAVAMLAFSERPGVQWASAWREAFMHCAGMYGPKFERSADWKHVAPLTRALLERSWLEMRLRVQTAEERLAEFSFGEMWSATFSPSANNTSNPPAGSARAAADRLRNFLISHYGQIYGSWPPSPTDTGAEDGEQMWLTRTVARALQHDFAALYDYLVDRDVVWDVSEARAGRKWMLVSSSGNQAFEADVQGLPMTDVLIEFDNRLRVPHIPHPHPLLPVSIPPQVTANSGSGMFKMSAQPQQRHAGRERRVALAYTESTNLDALGNSCSPSSLVDAFTRFEKTDCVGEVDPQMARRGRWVLAYGILQSLAAIGMDAPGIKHHENVSYHLSAKLKKPSWSREAGLFIDAKHEMSHCWTVPQTWEAEEQEEESQQETLLNSPLSPPGLSAAPSETGSSVRTSSSAGMYAQRKGGPDLLELPFRRREMNLARQSSTPSMTSLGSFLAVDETHEQRKRGGEVYMEAPLINNRGLSPIIRDFDEEP